MALISAVFVLVLIVSIIFPPDKTYHGEYDEDL